MSRRYVHTCLRVRDPEASVRFYGIELIDGGRFATPQDPED